MAGKRELLQALIRGIRQDIKDYEQLKALLAQQRQLMLNRDVPELMAHNQQQDALVAQLSERAGQRSELLRRIGVSADSAGMEKLIAALPVTSGQQVGLMWQQLLTLVRHSQDANEQNGRLLVRQQELITGLLQSEPSEYANPSKLEANQL